MSDAAQDDDRRPAATPGMPDPRAEAALFLVESLIHELVARAVLPLPVAIEVVQTATDAQRAISQDRGDDPRAGAQGLGFLSAIAASLRLDDRGLAHDAGSSGDRD